MHESVGRVDAIAPEALRALLPALRQARDELRSDLQDWLENAPEGSERFTAYHRAQALRSLEATFERIGELQPAMLGSLGVGRAETGTIAVSNLEHEVQRLSAVFGGGHVVLPQIDTAAVIAKGDRMLIKRHENSARRYAGGAADDIRHRLAVSLAKGDTFDQAMRRLRGSPELHAAVARSDPGAAAFGMADATFARWRHWADRLVRTENMHAYNVQHDLAIEQVNADRHEDEDEYLRRWDATADKVACERCKALDRTVATIKGDFAGGVHSPPLHPYCRCVVLAWLARWGNMKGEVPALHHGGDEEIQRPHQSEKQRVRAEADARKAAGEDLAAYAEHRSKEDTAASEMAAAKARQAKMLEEHKAKQAKLAAPTIAPVTDQGSSTARAMPDARGASPKKQPKPKPGEKLTPEQEAEAAARAVLDKKNPKRQAAARKAAEASHERRREIYSGVATNLPHDLQAAWSKEGHKFMKQEAGRIRGVEDRMTAASKLSEAFAEQYGTGDSAHEGDRSHKRSEIDAKHAESWADEQERKYYERAQAEARHSKHEDLGIPSKIDDDDPPF